MLRRPSLAVDKVSDVTLKIAMLVTLRHSRALHHPSRAFFHPAVAGHSDVAAQAVSSRHQLPSSSSAKRAIFKGHVVGAGLQPGVSKNTGACGCRQALVIGKTVEGLAAIGRKTKTPARCRRYAANRPKSGLVSLLLSARV